MLYIIRGVPGSGKSTLAMKLARSADFICEADQYFYKNGEYEFDFSKLGEAHSYCREKCENLMISNSETVVVSNTNTRESEFIPYIQLADKYGYSFTVIVLENRHGNTSVHNVPSDKVEQMRNRLINSIIL